MFVVIDGCDFGVICYCCWNRIIGLATVISVEDVQSDHLTKWSSSDSELLCVCAALWNARCLMEAEHFLLNCCSQHFLFIVEILTIWKIKFLLWRFQYSYFVVLGVSKRRVQIPWECLVYVSTLFFARLRICVVKWLLIVHNGFNCCLPSCWSAGGGLWEESSVTYALELYVQCVWLV